ncbi:MAG: hypothetical protein KBS79_04625 [Lachnospiraceae bacterium]|nr:hypothetical protein [Candidatus Minthocola equi]
MKLKGSLTIEASVVMVTVILCIASIITFAMGLRDETVSSADIRIEAIKQKPEHSMISEQIKTSELLYGRRMLEAELIGETVQANLDGSMKGIWPIGALKYMETINTNIYNPPKTLRLLSAVQELLSLR